MCRGSGLLVGAEEPLYASRDGTRDAANRSSAACRPPRSAAGPQLA